MTFRTLTALALATTLLGCPGDDPTDPTDPTDTRIDDVLALSGSVADGMDLYQTSASPTCASCHGADGSGGTAFPNLNNVVPPLSEAELADVLINGAGTMPAYGSASDQELADLIAYVLQEWGAAN